MGAEGCGGNQAPIRGRYQLPLAPIYHHALMMWEVRTNKAFISQACPCTLHAHTGTSTLGVDHSHDIAKALQLNRKPEQA